MGSVQWGRSFFFAVALLVSFTASAQKPNSGDNGAHYKKKNIADARFGTGKKEEFQKRAHHVAAALNRQILGQESTVSILQDRLLQYIEAFPNRKGEPVSLNLIGLPGVGKTAMLKTLQSIGLPVTMFNAQDYAASTSPRAFCNDLFGALNNLGALKFTDGEWKVSEPAIIVIDELDKVPELDSDQKENTQSLIGVVNSILSEGTFNMGPMKIDASNLMLLTTMNFSPKEIQMFTSEILGVNKSYYDLTTDDFIKFDDWIRNQPSARYRVLSQMFRSNTVSRLAPNTVILQPIRKKVYRRIIELVIADTIKSVAGKSVNVQIDPSLVDFLEKHAVFAPSGARETVFRARAIVEQLINFGIKATDPTGDSTVDRPRMIRISVSKDSANIEIAPLINSRGQLKARPSFTVNAAYDGGAKLFLAPETLATEKPTYPARTTVPKITKKEVLAARYPPTAEIPEGVYDQINSTLLGQKDAVGLVLDDMKKYLGRNGPASQEPSARILSGFPGIGKSELAKLVAEQLKLPIVKINLQQFSSDSPGTVKDFVNYLVQQTQVARYQAQAAGKPGKYILLLEELDKVFEINPQTGEFVNRPIMAIIKDLLSDGQISAALDGPTAQYDFRDAFIMGTMNFSVDRFGFTADPRLTSIGDVMNAWRRLSFSPMALKKLLGTMFLPETVSRMISRFTVMKPLELQDYRELIRRQVEHVVHSRLLDANGRNVAKIAIEISPNYEAYLEQETIIPSEGARYTAVSVKNKIASDLEAAMTNIPRKRDTEAAPLKIILDYDFAASQVVVKIARNETDGKTTSEPKEILRRNVFLQFPSPEIREKVPAQRMFVAAHEFGHAYMGLRLGLPIEHVVVVSPQPGIGGYVKFKPDSSVNLNSTRSLVFSVYSALASRAFERIVMSENPLDNRSVLEISSGPSGDIRQATYQLYMAIYLLGLDPQGGTIDANFNLGAGRYASIDVMPPQLVERLGHLMRAMENFMVADFLKLHPQDWYAEKIAALAQKGHVNGEQFAELVNFDPRSSKAPAVTDHFRGLFAKHLTETNESTQKVIDTQKVYMTEFTKLLDEKLHSTGESSCADILKGA